MLAYSFQELDVFAHTYLTVLFLKRYKRAKLQIPFFFTDVNFYFKKGGEAQDMGRQAER